MEIALLCLCVGYAVKYSFQLEIICAWGKANREIIFTCVRKHQILKTPPINFVSLGDGLTTKGKTAVKRRKKTNIKPEKKAYLKGEKANWQEFQSLKLEDLEFLCILRSQQDARLQEVMSEVGLCLATGLKRDLISSFLVCFGPWLPFNQRFRKSLQLSL